jgi:hypothetical protein
VTKSEIFHVYQEEDFSVTLMEVDEKHFTLMFEHSELCNLNKYWNNVHEKFFESTLCTLHNYMRYISEPLNVLKTRIEQHRYIYDMKQQIQNTFNVEFADNSNTLDIEIPHSSQILQVELGFDSFRFSTVEKSSGEIPWETTGTPLNIDCYLTLIFDKFFGIDAIQRHIENVFNVQFDEHRYVSKKIDSTNLVLSFKVFDDGIDFVVFDGDTIVFDKFFGIDDINSSIRLFIEKTNEIILKSKLQKAFPFLDFEGGNCAIAKVTPFHMFQATVDKSVFHLEILDISTTNVLRSIVQHIENIDTSIRVFTHAIEMYTE